LRRSYSRPTLPTCACMSPPVAFRSDTSPKWTPALLKELGVTLDKDDGCFYISWADFKKYPGHARTNPTLFPPPCTTQGEWTCVDLHSPSHVAAPTYTPPRLAFVLPSGFLVVFEKPNRSSFTCTLLHPPSLPSPGIAPQVLCRCHGVLPGAAPSPWVRPHAGCTVARGSPQGAADQGGPRSLLQPHLQNGHRGVGDGE
jgi:hypothetical protein